MPDLDVNFVWGSDSEKDWRAALAAYYDKVKPENHKLEQRLNGLTITTSSDITDWYSFLLEEYFVWKYTAKNRLATTTKAFRNAYENDRGSLDTIVSDMFASDLGDIRAGLLAAKRIAGLGVAGASGLLSILFPKYFGTVDQFVVKSLLKVRDLPERDELALFRPENLTVGNAVILIRIMRVKAVELNSLFKSDFWTPRRIDMVLWGSR